MVKHWIQIFAAVVSIIAVVVALYIQFVESQKAASISKLVDETDMIFARLQTEKLQKEITKLLEEQLYNISEEDVSKLSLNERFSSLEKKIKQIDEKTLAIRQAINPLNPNEVLTIARLTDEVSNLKDEFNNLSRQVKQSQKEFKDSILRELKSSNDSTNLILVVLIPLVLNFLYTLWKDFKSEAKITNAPNKANSADS